MSATPGGKPAAASMEFETLHVRQEGAVIFADIAAPPMYLLGTERVRDLVSLIQRAEGNEACQVLLFASSDADYFIALRTSCRTMSGTTQTPLSDHDGTFQTSRNRV